MTKPLNGTHPGLVVTVFGPGRGESIVVTVEGDTWIVIDSCVDRKQVVAEKLLKDAEAQWSCVVLTHPHTDHCRGLVNVLACRTPDDEGGVIGCAYPFVYDPATWNQSADYMKRYTYGELENVIAALQDSWERNEHSRWDLRRGQKQEFGPAVVTVLHPDDELVETARKKERFNMNRLSAPLLLEWKNTRILLGADLPQKEWDTLDSSLDLHDHHLLKFPHHGSNGSLSEMFGQSSEEVRTWLFTPYSSSRIPGYNEGEGLDWSLDRTDQVALTGLPVASRKQANYPIETTLGQLADGAHPSPLKTTVMGLDAFEVPTEPPEDNDYRCFISVAFNGDGEMVETAYGDGSAVVTR